VIERLSPAERERVEAWRRDPERSDAAEREAERERIIDRLFWAAIGLTSNLEVCGSIMRGQPVLARQLDAEALRRALRGATFPPPDSYIEITGGMLDAIAEAGSR
jgi:hypothetical protein